MRWGMFESESNAIQATEITEHTEKENVLADLSVNSVCSVAKWF